MAMGRRPQRDTRAPQIRVNHRIRVPEVRVVLEDGTLLGVMPTSDALRKAVELGLDLVEINPKSVPPVCKILDFGKFKYEEKKKASDAKRSQTVVELKEIKLRPKTDDHDMEVKLRAARRFVEAGNKVKFTVRFRGREITHPERAKMQLDQAVEHTQDIANVEQRPQMEGRAMSLVLAPKPQVLQRVQAERKSAAHEARQKRDHVRDDEGALGSETDEDDQSHEDEDEDDDDEDEDEDDED
jgi:translation initiation factor IF-3